MAEMILRAAKCGHHFEDDCISCQSALECTNREMDELRAKARHLEAENRRLREALEPFADCCEFINADESDEEWAKFRLLIKDYRRARTALEGKEQGHATE